MAHVERHEQVELERPTLIEGFLGVGLVGKVATDHVVDEVGMTYFGTVRCPGLPAVAVYEAGDRRAPDPRRRNRSRRRRTHRRERPGIPGSGARLRVQHSRHHSDSRRGVDDEGLRTHAEEIRTEKEQLARRMGESSGDDSSQAEPTGMSQ